MLIRRSEAWTRQPQFPARQDAGNQFGAACDFAWVPRAKGISQAQLVGISGVAVDFQSQIGIAKSPAVAARPFAVVLVMAFPTASVGNGYGIYVGSGNGFRLDVFTTAGGIYAAWTANGLANGGLAARDVSGKFDMRPVVLVTDWTSTGQTSYWKRLGDSQITTWSDTLGYISPTDTTVMLGESGNGAAKMYGAFILRGNVGAAGAARLLENPWQIFAPERRTLFVPSGAGGTLNGSASGSDTASGSADLAAQVALAAVGVSTADGAGNLAASIPLLAAGLSVAGGRANATATITLSAAGLAQAAGAAGLSASVLLAGAGAAQSAGNATLAAQLNALAEGAAQADGSANLTGGSQGQLAAQGGSSSSGQAALTVTISLQAAGSASSSGTAAANVLTQGGMAADGKSVASGTAAPTVRIAATADGKAQAGGIATGIIQGAGQITAIGNAQASGAATYTVTATLTAAGFVQAMGAARLAVEIPLAALGAASASGSASLTQVPDYVPAMPLSLNAALTHRTILLSTAARTIKLNHEVRRAYR